MRPAIKGITDLDLADIRFVAQGVIVSIRKEKQDQAGAGRELAIAYGAHAETCPVRSLASWLQVRGSEPGPLFTVIVDGKPVIQRLYSRSVSNVVLCDELGGVHRRTANG